MLKKKNRKKLLLSNNVRQLDIQDFLNSLKVCPFIS